MLLFVFSIYGISVKLQIKRLNRRKPEKKTHFDDILDESYKEGLISAEDSTGVLYTWCCRWLIHCTPTGVLQLHHLIRQHKERCFTWRKYRGSLTRPTDTLKWNRAIFDAANYTCAFTGFKLCAVKWRTKSQLQLPICLSNFNLAGLIRPCKWKWECTWQPTVTF